MTGKLRFDPNAMKDIREALGLSYQGFSERLAHFGVCVSDNTIRNWEAGRTSPNAKALEAICNATGCPTARFFPSEDAAGREA